MTTKSVKNFRLRALLLSVLMASGLFVVMTPIVSAAPSTFTVTNTNDSGAGSLREAIASANANGNPADQDVIEFAIAASGDITIQPQTSLVISQSLIIDGYTQGDATANTAAWPQPFDGTLRIAIDNSVSGPIQVTGDNVTFKGLVVNGGNGNIDLDGADNFVLEGSYIDTDHTGLLSRKFTASPSGSISVVDSANVRFGGALPQERNILGFCQLSCVEAEGSATTGLLFFGNNVGLGADSVVSLDTASIFYSSGAAAIRLHSGASDIQIGGEQPGEGNSLEHNWKGAVDAEDVSDLRVLGNRIMYNFNTSDENQGLDAGIRLAGVTASRIGSSGTGRNIIAGNWEGALRILDSPTTSAASENIVVEGNYFGVMADNTTAFKNVGFPNIMVEDASDAIMINNNVIKNADESGVIVRDDAQRVSIIENSIVDSNVLGIDLGGNSSVEPNDTFDNDEGANGLLNYPANVTYELTGGDTVMRYDLDVAAGEYRVDFYANAVADSSGHGEGEQPLDSHEINKSGSGAESFSYTLSGDGYSNISAIVTAIDDSSPTGFGSSSEFSSIATVFVPAPPPDPVVDLGVSFELANPEAVQIGATLNYDVTITNYGPDSIDISGYDNSNIGVNALTQFIISPDLTYQGVTNSSTIACSSFGPGSASLNPVFFANHTDYEVALCGYQGSSNVLGSGGTFTFTIQFTVTGGSDLNFDLMLIGPISQYESDYEALGAVFSLNADIFDALDDINVFPPNNFQVLYYPSQDINTTKEIVDPPNTISSGQEVTYRFTLTNTGNGNVSLNQFDSGGVNPFLTSLLIDILPSELTYQSVSGADVACSWYGAGTASLTGAIFGSHTDRGLFFCAYTGTAVLQPGESYSFEVTTTALQDVTQEMTNFALGPGLGLLEDPDNFTLRRAFALSASGTTGDDLIDILSNSQDGLGFALAAFTPSNGQENGGSGQAAVPGGSLATTGQLIVLPTIVLLCIFVSSAAVAKLVSQRERLR